MLKISSSSSRVDDTLYKQKLQSVRVLQTPNAGRLIARWLIGLLIIFIVILFLPWQQNITGTGNVTALSPADRPQTIETAIAGRINEWRVGEGDFVHKGDTILVLEEIKEKFFDPEQLERIGEMVTAKKSSINAKNAKINAYREQIATLRAGLELKIEQLKNKVIQKRLKVESDSMALEAAKIDYQIAQRQMQGTQTMYDSGLVALTKWESARSKVQKAQAKQTEYLNKLNSSRNELEIAKLDLSTTRAETLGKIAKAQSELSASISDLEDSKGDLAKKRNEYANIKIRNEQYFIRAPQDGYVVRALKSGVGETVKEGEAVVTVMPNEPSVAVEIFVKAMDVPLIDTGRHVRLEFDGWPALQFSGWPSVSVGTFGGKVSVIDYIDSKKGKYRILITPETDQNDEDQPWPKELRQGSGVFGWVMLDEVPVWYEIWRQINGFPPTVESYEDEQKAAKDAFEKSKGK